MSKSSKKFSLTRWVGQRVDEFLDKRVEQAQDQLRESDSTALLNSDEEVSRIEIIATNEKKQVVDGYQGVKSWTKKNPIKSFSIGGFLAWLILR